MRNEKSSSSQSKNGTKSQSHRVTPQTREKPCSDCGGPVRRKTIAQEFEREGIRINISGIEAWVCSRCGEIYFEPGAADQLVQAANSLYELARAGQQHKGKLRAAVS